MYRNLGRGVNEALVKDDLDGSGIFLSDRERGDYVYILVTIKVPRERIVISTISGLDAQRSLYDVWGGHAWVLGVHGFCDEVGRGVCVFQGDEDDKDRGLGLWGF